MNSKLQPSMSVNLFRIKTNIAKLFKLQPLKPQQPFIPYSCLPQQQLFIFLSSFNYDFNKFAKLLNLLKLLNPPLKNIESRFGNRFES